MAGHRQDPVPRRWLREITPRGHHCLHRIPRLSLLFLYWSQRLQTLDPTHRELHVHRGRNVAGAGDQETFVNSAQGRRWGKCSVLPALEPEMPISTITSSLHCDDQIADVFFIATVFCRYILPHAQIYQFHRALFCNVPWCEGVFITLQAA